MKFIVSLLSSTKALIAGLVGWLITGVLWYASVEETKGEVKRIDDELKTHMREYNSTNIRIQREISEANAKLDILVQRVK